MDDPKRELVRAWLIKARNDFDTARQIASRPEGHLDAAIYHCQQAAEKAVMGFLAFQDHQLERSHDVERLVSLANRYDATFVSCIEAAILLTPTQLLIDIPARLRRWNPRVESSMKR